MKLIIVLKKSLHGKILSQILAHPCNRASYKKTYKVAQEHRFQRHKRANAQLIKQVDNGTLGHKLSDNRQNGNQSII